MTSLYHHGWVHDGVGTSRAWTGALVEAIVLSGISVGVWSGLTTLTWVRAIWLAFGCYGRVHEGGLVLYVHGLELLWRPLS
jgi:hypothetical protein